MPPWMGALTYLSPLKYFLDLGFGIFLKGVGLGAMWDRLLGLALLGGAVFILGASVSAGPSHEAGGPGRLPEGASSLAEG